MFSLTYAPASKVPLLTNVPFTIKGLLSLTVKVVPSGIVNVTPSGTLIVLPLRSPTSSIFAPSLVCPKILDNDAAATLLFPNTDTFEPLVLVAVIVPVIVLFVIFTVCVVVSLVAYYFE